MNPRWILNETWAISTDPLNWKLLQRTLNKAGEPSKWKVVGYYPTPEMLLSSLLRKIQLAGSDEPDLIEHLNHALRTATAAYSAFTELLDALPPIPVDALHTAA